MMKQLLETQFSQRYDTHGRSHPINEVIINNEIALCDYKACNRCIPFFASVCGHETFLLHVSSPVKMLDIESFINSFPNIQGERCDGLFHDGRKIVLMDMYCGMSEYLDPHLNDGNMVIGKKTKVRQQIEKTIDRLYSIPNIAVFVDGLSEKFGIFAYRAKDDGLFANVPVQISRSKAMFLRSSKEQAKRRLAAPMSHGFKYVMHSYPSVYKW